MGAAQSIRLDNGVFRLEGWDASRYHGEWPAVLSVHVGDSATPILGSYRLESGALVFQPRFPLQPGLRYRAVFHPAGIKARFDIPARDTPPAFVEQVYPTTDRVPENLLKLYLHFSAPMSRREAYRRVRLLDESGKAIPDPFLELEEELWDREGRRLTILFDPGRIKRGLVPHEEVGPPLVAGKRYTLEIDAGWPDAAGKPLKEPWRKPFTVGPADRDPPSLKTWKVTAPKAGSRDPLVVDFPEPLDQALLLHMIEVLDARGRHAGGWAEVDRAETRWRFTPAQPWTSGVHSLRVDRALEDLAGNKVDRPFEVDLFERIEKSITRRFAALDFRVR
jgi:hypothetical protein